MTSPPDRFTSLRRNSVQNGSVSGQASSGDRTQCITITVHEYRQFKATAQKYANLRQNLLRSGQVDERAIDLLSQDDEAIQNAPDYSQVVPGHSDYDDNGGAALYGNDDEHGVRRVNWRSQFPTNSRFHNFVRDRSPEEEDWSETDTTSGDAATCQDHANTGQSDASPQYERQCMRTFQLVNLPEGTTHGDVTAAVRGGILLDIYIRSQERTAAVSFLRAEDAKYFFDHVKKHDLYIKNKRVDVKWYDRQFTLAGHMANKIASGATRNLVIRRCDPRITEQTVREDLDHIHNLVVIKVEFVGGSCYIRTNSVNNAMFARTCMMSRVLYKGSKIEWEVDECAQPYDPEPVSKPRQNAQLRKATTKPMVNRFQLLNLDDEEEDDDIAATLKQPNKAVGIAA